MYLVVLPVLSWFLQHSSESLAVSKAGSCFEHDYSMLVEVDQPLKAFCPSLASLFYSFLVETAVQSNQPKKARKYKSVTATSHW